MHECHGLQCGFCTPGLRRVDHRVPRATTPIPTTRRSATGCRATCAAAPATRASSRPCGHGRRRAGSSRHDASTVARHVDGGQPLRRPARPAPRGRPAAHRPRHATSTTSSCPGCCTSPSCAATSPAARSPRSTSTAARELPGVVAVFTGADLNGDVRRGVGRLRGRRRRPRRSACLADGDVRFVGEPIALVVAESRYIAEDACELIEVDIEPLDADRRPRRRAGRRRPRRCTPDRDDNVAGAIPAAADPELDAIFDVGRPRRHRDVRPAPLPVRADGDPRRRVDWDALPQRARRAHLDAGPPRRARLPRRGRSACPRTASASSWATSAAASARRCS